MTKSVLNTTVSNELRTLGRSDEVKYVNKKTGETVALTAAEEARFFDNRDPREWSPVLK
tara:strand:- start:4522 stop:4698 length:177 start_codon:yes stop_codon:yes gene_type:complete